MRKRSNGWLGLMAGALILAAGCGGGAPTGDVDKIAVETSSLFVTVRNTAGLALNDVRIEIVPAGRATTFSTYVSRMENSDKRDISLSTFRDRDGASFSLRVSRPGSVVVTAQDLNGKTVRVEVPWKN